MPTYGTHTPDVKYVPSSLMAYGYKGVKPVPGVPNMYLMITKTICGSST